MSSFVYTTPPRNEKKNPPDFSSHDHVPIRRQNEHSTKSVIVFLKTIQTNTEINDSDSRNTLRQIISNFRETPPHEADLVFQTINDKIIPLANQFMETVPHSPPSKEIRNYLIEISNQLISSLQIQPSVQSLSKKACARRLF